LRHSLDLALLTKWPVFVQNAFGNPAYVIQTNLNGKLRKKLGGPSKNLGGAWPTQAPLRISTELVTPNSIHKEWDVVERRNNVQHEN